MAARSAKTKLVLNITSFLLQIFLNVVFYALIVMFILKIGTLAYEFSYQIYGAVAVDEAPGNERVVEIRKGESTMNIASKLELNKLVKNKYTFYIRAKLSDSVILPGTYTLNSAMPYNDIFNIITKQETAEDTESSD